MCGRVPVQDSKLFWYRWNSRWRVGEQRNGQGHPRKSPVEVHDVKDLCSLSSVEQNRERRRRHSVQNASSGRSCFTIGPFGVLC
jgi:hypothetical protein